MPSVLTALRASDQLSEVSDALGAASLLDGLLNAERLRRDALAGELPAATIDALARLAVEEPNHLLRAHAVRALSVCQGSAVDAVLVRALSDPDPGVVERAAWGMSDRPMVADAIRPLVDLVKGGGFAAALASASLEHWGATDGRRLSREIWRAIGSADDAARPRLVEQLGLCRDAPVPVRVRTQGVGRGLGVAQVMLQGHLDADLTAAGSGDSGGLVTLLVNLAHELAEQPGVHHVLTIARDPRGRAAPVGGETEALGPRSVLVRAEFGPPGPLAAPELWSHRVEIEAELTRLLVAAPEVDVVHLRATDGGAWAAMRVCRALDIPYVFTIAPDPHAVIAAAQRSGAVTPETFGAADAREHWWFRVALLADLVDGAAGLAVFPRPGGTSRLSELLGIDLAGRVVTVVPEGAGLRAPEAAVAALEQARRTGDLPAVLADLVAAVSSFGPDRQGLPLLVTAGRLHPVKGVDALVDAWAGDQHLREGFNLVIVGGDITAPSPVERGVMDAIQAALDRHPGGADGLIMLGARPHQQLALVLAAAHAGLGPAIASDGVYVCASVKEEFGLAIVEALAAGLTVVAPDDGGPPTYIEDRVTGVLVDPASPGSLRIGIARAAMLRQVRGRADRARRRISTDVSLAAMAQALVGIYAEAMRS